jgi:hypothetical protein
MDQDTGGLVAPEGGHGTGLGKFAKAHGEGAARAGLLGLQCSAGALLRGSSGLINDEQNRPRRMPLAKPR